MSRKAIITSDLHHGITSPVCIMSLYNEMFSNNPDIIIIAGDIGEPAKEFDKCLSIFSAASCPVGIIIGNHDLYATGGNHSEELWTTILPDITKAHGLAWMEEENIVISDTAFVGSLAWYDYSSKAPDFAHLPDEAFKIVKRQLVADGQYVDWQRWDTAFADELKQCFIQRIANAQEDPAIKRIIVVTHVPLMPEQLVSMKTDRRMADAYFGNLTTGKEVLKFSKVTDVISGHTHRPVSKTVGKINTQTVPGDYGKPGYIVLPF